MQLAPCRCHSRLYLGPSLLVICPIYRGVLPLPYVHQLGSHHVVVGFVCSEMGIMRVSILYSADVESSRNVILGCTWQDVALCNRRDTLLKARPISACASKQD